MNTPQRPVSVTILACVYLVVGAAGFAYYFRSLLSLQQDSVWAVLTELLAIVSGAFMVRGRDWARWLALAWIVFHVVLSAFHSVRELAIHGLLCAVIAWILFRSQAARYFRSGRKGLFTSAPS
jgi:hypothetical protein